jgi:hypothetical protein
VAETEEPDHDAEPLAREGEHLPPVYRAPAYHCPACGVLAKQLWEEATHKTFLSTGRILAPVTVAYCTNCHYVQVWVSYGDNDFRLVKPVIGGGPRPHVDLPPDVRADYEEARAIVALSPRGACALLRLATQKLVNDHLQTEGGDLNDRIGRLVANGLPPMVQQALDSLRVIGNEAVHPGELDLRDDPETASGLFMLMNVIVEDRISRPKQIAQMYAKLPAGKLQGILHRDRPTP